jgi:hypothetical protein
MIGNSLPLCYLQIGVSDLLDHRGLVSIWLLTKHIRLLGVAAFLGGLRGLELVPSKWRYIVPPTSG